MSRSMETRSRYLSRTKTNNEDRLRSGERPKFRIASKRKTLDGNEEDILAPNSRRKQKSKSTVSCLHLEVVNNELSYSRQYVLGRGTFTVVHRGTYKGKEVAVKKVALERLVAGDDCNIKSQIDLLHTNVLKMLLVKEDKNFRYVHHI